MRPRTSAALLALLLVAAEPAGDLEAERPAVVVIDPGHGGADFGARGLSGGLEKDLALRVARRLGVALEAEGWSVVFTREDDSFVTLAERTEIANRSRGDLFLSIHANAADDPEASGVETFFLSLEASDDEARRVAMAENGVFHQTSAVPDSADIVGGILGDMIRTENLRVSSEVASAVQHELSALPGGSRGVKQAPFVVLMGVNMPAVLIEAGFLTNRDDERRLGSRAHRGAIAAAIARGLEAHRRDAHVARNPR
jgi:N-acetylmuramoyl-L-alanine amidase